MNASQALNKVCETLYEISKASPDKMDGLSEQLEHFVALASLLSRKTKKSACDFGHKNSHYYNLVRDNGASEEEAFSLLVANLKKQHALNSKDDSAISSKQLTESH